MILLVFMNHKIEEKIIDWRAERTIFNGFATKMEYQGDGLAEGMEHVHTFLLVFIKRVDHKVEEEFMHW